MASSLLFRSAASVAKRPAASLAARSFSTSLAAAKQIDTITVFGGGLMGAGIAQVSAQNGLKVIIADVNDKALANGRDIIHKSISRVAKKAHPDDAAAQKALVDKTFANITLTTNAEEAVSATDLVVEAIVENIKVKQGLFERLDKSAPAHTIFTSNTSSLSIGEIAKPTSSDRKARFGGLHFFSPVPQMKLVEVIRIPETSDETFNSLIDVCKRIKKTTVACKDTPGFIVNRLLVPYMLEAMRLVERGEATVEDVDTAMKLGAGVPMGPLTLGDFVGLDTMKHISDGWRESRVSTGEISAEQVKPVKTLDDLIKAGKLGRKTGEGFYKYD